MKEGEESIHRLQARKVHGLRRRSRWSWPSTRRVRPTPSERKVEICQRAYKAADRASASRPKTSSSIANVFAIATGMEEHRKLRASTSSKRLKVIKARLARTSTSLAGCRTSVVFVPRQRDRSAGRCTRYSCSTRSLPGLDMAIVNAGQLDIYDTDRSRPARSLRGRDPQPRPRPWKASRAPPRRLIELAESFQAARTPSTEKAARGMARLGSHPADRACPGQGPRRLCGRGHRGSPPSRVRYVGGARSRSSKAP